MQEELSAIKKLIDDVNVVSFDIFDTLLLRNVLEPRDIFRILAKDVKEKFEIDDFLNKRVEAEQNSRVDRENYETTLDLIYEQMKDFCGKNTNEIKNMELALENQFLVINPFMKQVFDYAKESGKKLYCISDMYLPASFIEKKLKSVGYDGFKLYVSCESGKVKGNGTLFHYVKEQEKLDFTEWFHIGDNKISDFETPCELGIMGYHYQSVLARSKDSNGSGTIEESILKAIGINRRFTNDLDGWQSMGCRYVAPLYFGFTNWLYSLTNKKDNLYFLARDGYIIKKIYDILKDKMHSNIDTYYFYCSRRSFELPSLIKGSKDHALEILTRWNMAQDHFLTIHNILTSVGLNPADYKETMTTIANVTEETVLTLENLNMVRKFLGFIYDDIEASLQKKQDLVLAYMDQMKMNDYEKVNLVDIGWSGSLQHAMNELLGDKFYGFYFGNNNTPCDNVRYNSIAYMFNNDEPHERMVEVMYHNMMYELLFSAPHGSVIGFEKKKNEIEPILEDSKDDNDQAVKIFQDAALETVKEYVEYYDYLKDVSFDVIYSFFHQFIIKRDYEDMKMFQTIQTAIGYDNNKILFVPTFTREEIKKNPKEFYRKIEAAPWRETYMLSDIQSKEEYVKFQKTLRGFRYRMTQMRRLVNMENVKKAVRHPRRALRTIKRKL